MIQLASLFYLEMMDLLTAYIDDCVHRHRKSAVLEIFERNYSSASSKNHLFLLRSKGGKFKECYCSLMDKYKRFVKKILRPKFLRQSNQAKKRVFRDICNKSKQHPGVFICHDQKKSRRQLAINDTLEAAMTGASVTKG